MKKSLVCSVLSACPLAGCTMTSVKVESDPPWSVLRISILQKSEIPKITVHGVGVMEGYKTGGDADLVSALIAMGARAAMASQGVALPTVPAVKPVAPAASVDEPGHDEP